MNIASFMKRSVLTARPDQTIEEAARLMRVHQCRHLPVVSGAAVVGILSDRDVALASVFRGKDAQQLRDVRTEGEVRVEEVMTPYPAVLSPTDSLTAAIQAAVTHKLGAFPVVEMGALVGIVTVIDLLAASLDALESRG